MALVWRNWVQLRAGQFADPGFMIVIGHFATEYNDTTGQYTGNCRWDFSYDPTPPYDSYYHWRRLIYDKPAQFTFSGSLSGECAAMNQVPYAESSYYPKASAPAWMKLWETVLDRNLSFSEMKLGVFQWEVSLEKPELAVSVPVLPAPPDFIGYDHGAPLDLSISAEVGYYIDVFTKNLADIHPGGKPTTVFWSGTVTEGLAFVVTQAEIFSWAEDVYVSVWCQMSDGSMESFRGGPFPLDNSPGYVSLLEYDPKNPPLAVTNVFLKSPDGRAIPPGRFTVFGIRGQVVVDYVNNLVVTRDENKVRLLVPVSDTRVTDEVTFQYLADSVLNPPAHSPDPVVIKALPIDVPETEPTQTEKDDRPLQPYNPPVPPAPVPPIPPPVGCSDACMLGLIAEVASHRLVLERGLYSICESINGIATETNSAKRENVSSYGEEIKKIREALQQINLGTRVDPEVPEAREGYLTLANLLAKILAGRPY